MQVCVCTCIHLCLHVCVCVCACIYQSKRTHPPLTIHVCMYICMLAKYVPPCMCMCGVPPADNEGWEGCAPKWRVLASHQSELSPVLLL